MQRRQFLTTSLKAALGAAVLTRCSITSHAQEAASYFNLPVMIHMGQPETPMGELVQLLKPGDVDVHEFPSTTQATVH